MRMPHTRTACALHAHRTRNACAPHVHRMCTACAHRMCTPHALLMHRTCMHAACACTLHGRCMHAATLMRPDSAYPDYGIYTYANGDRYGGSWRQGKKHRAGTYYFSGGAKYQGEYKVRFRPALMRAASCSVTALELVQWYAYSRTGTVSTTILVQ